MITIITMVHVFVSIFLILVVLLQSGKDGGMGAAFGSGSSNSVLGTSGGVTVLGKATYFCAAIFMLTSISLTLISSKSGKSDLFRSEAKQTSEAPAAMKTNKLDKQPTNEKAPAKTE